MTPCSPVFPPSRFRVPVCFRLSGPPHSHSAFVQTSVVLLSRRTAPLGNFWRVSTVQEIGVCDGLSIVETVGSITTNPVTLFLLETLSERYLSHTGSHRMLSKRTNLRRGWSDSEYTYSQETATDTICSTKSDARTPCVPCKVPNLNSRLFLFGMRLAL